MRFAGTLVALTLMPAWAQIRPKEVVAPATATRADPVKATAPVKASGTRISIQNLSELEKRLDSRLVQVGGTDPLDLLGATRGIYLDGYGVVFTTEVSLIVTPTINPFRTAISKEEAAKVHQRKIDHLPLLRTALREMWTATATALPSVPENEQVVLAVRLLYLPWEDTRGLPGQIVLKADRKALLTGDLKTEDQ